MEPSEKRDSTEDKDERADIKVFNDSVHGTIRLHPLLVKIIDTPEFQRLRNIKQLGAAYRVYPGASHNRFEHSIGVCHLAGIFIEKLWKKQPRTVQIDEQVVLCVKIAGLCHDIGHGPFSHLFDKEFEELCRQADGAEEPKWKHEEMSVKILENLFDKNSKIKDALVKYKLKEEQKKLIYDLIHHKKDTEFADPRKYLYQIVANDNGLDVDRWDYFARDSLHLGLKYSFDHLRCMEMARVIGGDICYRNKEAVNIYNMFYTRFNLYRCAYYHPVNSAVQLMIADAFYLAKDNLKFPGHGGSEVCLDKIYEDEQAYHHATDFIYQEIQRWRPLNGDQAQPAQQLLERIEKRDFYQVVCDLKAEPKQQNNKNLSKDIKKWLNEQPESKQCKLCVKVVNIGFGGKSKYPLADVRFFEKGEDPQEAAPLPEEELPRPIASMQSQDIRIRIFSKLSRDEYKRTFSSAAKEEFIAKLKTIGSTMDQDTQAAELTSTEQLSNDAPLIMPIAGN